MASMARITLSISHGFVLKFYSDVITRSCVQLINTLIDTSMDTFFSKLRAFLAEQRKRGKANVG